MKYYSSIFTDSSFGVPYSIKYFTLINLITKATKNRSYVSARWFALFFFIFMALAGIMLAVYCNEVVMGDKIVDFITPEGTLISIGWGMIVAMCASLLTIIFAPGKNK